MRAVVQRVKRAEVRVGEEVTGRIEAGLCVLLGVAEGDGPGDAEALADKVCHLRILSDEAGKMNRSVLESGGGILAVSQFTLHADTSRGRRPSFGRAMTSALAEPLFAGFCAACRAHGVAVQTGLFGAEMLVNLWGDGPVTILLDTKLGL